ncbi:hypothetical protein EI555_018364 [Monodon monoceros]|uniref:Uncharacterized protein n=1 Tax=Monodon monoceros TaxID=40151 RepID=A0A4U1F3S8_MONMO|nr:hypothetical protein EI555_018364 [Monodon monoceros]
MGKCLKSPTSDDISLPHKSQSDWASFGKGTELDQEPLLPYLDQVPVLVYHHLGCTDDWLMKSFTCPSCMETVDAALLLSYETN